MTNYSRKSAIIHTGTRKAWDKYYERLGEIIEKDPQPAGWICAHGVQGGYNGRGEAIRIPYQSLLILAGFENITAKQDRSYAFRENLKLISKGLISSE